MSNDLELYNAVLATSEFLTELLDILTKDHPEILVKATIQTVDKNPELFKKKE